MNLNLFVLIIKVLWSYTLATFSWICKPWLGLNPWMFSMLSRSISQFVSISWTLRVLSTTFFQSSQCILQHLEQSSSSNLSHISNQFSVRTKVSRWLAIGIRKSPMNPFTLRYESEEISFSGSINIIPSFRNLPVRNSYGRLSLLNSFESDSSLYFHIRFISNRYSFVRVRTYELVLTRMMFVYVWLS